MAAKQNVETLLPAIRNTAKGDKLISVTPIANREGELSWYVLGFEDPSLRVVMPSWWYDQYLTEDVFPLGLYKGMPLNAGYHVEGVDENGKPIRRFYLEDASK